ncbi:integrase, partial [Lacticaseibacillus rhamnosus]
MYFEERKRKNGKSTYYAVDRYVDSLTGKAKREVVKFTTNTARARKQAERDLAAKIEELIAEKQGAFNGAAMVTFGELKAKWLETWQTTVKPPTVTREKMVLKRIAELMADDVLLEVITPLLIQNLLNDYKKKYHSTHSTMQ